MIWWFSEISNKIVVIIFELVFDLFLLICQLTHTQSLNILFQFDLPSSSHEWIIKVESLKGLLQSFNRLFFHPLSDSLVTNRFRFGHILLSWSLAENREGIIWHWGGTISPAAIFLLDEPFKLFDFRFALDDYFFSIGEEVTYSGSNQLIEDVKLHG